MQKPAEIFTDNRDIKYKVCGKCKTLKSLDNFYQHITGKKKGFFHSYCKNCNLEYQREHKERYRKRKNSFHKKYILLDRVAKRERAIRKFFVFKKRNNIIPPPCVMCNSKSNYRIESHHQDYNRPLFVVWLCQGCHTKVHWKKIDVSNKGIDYAQFRNNLKGVK